MTNLDVSNSSTDSSSGSSSDSSSSGSTSTSSGSGSSSSDSESSTSDTPATTNTTPAPKSPQKTEEVKKKEEPKPRRPSKAKVSSSSDDDTPKPTSPKPAPPRRRISAKPKSAAAVLAKGKTAQRIPSGAKTPKPIPKTIQKAPPKPDTGALKKKSIFSPDNSSESESESKSSTTKSPKASPRPKRGSRKSSDEKDTSPATTRNNSADNDDSNSKSDSNAKRKSVNRPSGPPPKKVIEDKSASSCTSSQSSVESVSSDSDSEPTPKKEPLKTGKTKPPSSATKQEIRDQAAKSGDSGDSGAVATMPRKLTRSLSARVSRLATVSRRTNTDTDSDVDEKSNDKTSNTSNSTSKDMKKPPRGRAPPARSPVVLPSPQEPARQRCPVRGCDSSGHLGGKSNKHMTWDACPIYHNVTAAWCVAAGEERAAAAVARRRALQQLHARPRAMPTLEQRAYQLKVKDMRSKWKGSQELREKLAASGNEEITEDREPILEGFAPDYDLRLFREAQALAAIKIEEELGDIPTDKGTRYVVMGKYMMEVWYQSPYPGDAARVPRLFVCEFCLNHHKSATGAQRHKVKCVWNHPPGDEVYRKDNLSVWQVDGRKHKQYCQQLCLLAKFFLDHKTLYYDVEPFLFYVMTNADHEGCHIVGYFSKEKNSFLNYNVSCILTLPPYQRQGYGRLLIDFSYLLTKEEGKVGSPETPLSDLGLISYRSYWKEALLKRLCSAPGPTLCIRDLSKDLAIASSDIVSTLQERGLMKYWKGKHIVLKKQEVLEEVSRRAARARCVDAACLRWWGSGAAPPAR
ncbi:histone acetyltransferase KAT7 [Helicoverpa armigera]|uniref:histone acetyltransferase KAT7 n=1 Tax=Helicoverpa zea TaxID=7113 RepID=UPI001F571B3E|nr:histone acetyltransferase KAT7 [Helicoverpa zea]XP_047019366.1 histone acetyltransferase KAT7 [Helicoverpa zea]XP_049696512.1 histone acetyltransferase KAT7 [Helicoverpa armigera]